MNVLKLLLLSVLCCRSGTARLTIDAGQRNTSVTAIALSEIINGLKPRQLTILATPGAGVVADLQEDVSDFVFQLHKLYFKTVIFYELKPYLQFIEASLRGSIESVSLIFAPPYDLARSIRQRQLAHRLSLFIFYWGARQPPPTSALRLEEPMRAVIITRPRSKAFRIYYNQAVPHGGSNLRLVNWYDAENLGLQRSPLLPLAASVYANFQGRVFRVPVFHSPPWFWVNYDNDTSLDYLLDASNSSHNDMNADYVEVNVTGGRDHCLLLLLAQHMNFQFVYIDTPGRTQGSLRADVDAEQNDSFTGGIRLLQQGQADLLLGDISLSWERRKAVEFSFFTLADSGAFATHAPRRLNEALAIIRPFKMDVWPYLILTVLFSGPIFYAIIAIPLLWQAQRCYQEAPRRSSSSAAVAATFHMAYIREITANTQQHAALLQRLVALNEAARAEEAAALPARLFDRCIWFTVQLFLKQSCQEIYDGYRVKFLMIVYWVAATYVLADVYAAQLTSQFASPPHEAPLNTLQRLHRAMLEDGYQLFVEKESSSLEMLENGTEIFRSLFALMQQQRHDEGHLIDSVEAGIRLIADGLENKVVLGGRETLYFNIQQFGAKTFQLSQKLYTRYSAVALQIGCPFLDSLNDVLIHLFESGIMTKMTSAEYETQSRMIRLELAEQRQRGETARQAISAPATAEEPSRSSGSGAEANGKSAEKTAAEKAPDAPIIQPLNLRMLQGAFIVLLVGYAAASVILLLELLCHRYAGDFRWAACEMQIRRRWRRAYRRVRRAACSAAMRISR